MLRHVDVLTRARTAQYRESVSGIVPKIGV
jgi:hypothetical protein